MRYMGNRVNGERLTVNRSFRVRPVHRLLFTVHVLFYAGTSSVLAQIQDNSFLVEEAYNQESGVVQHISTFERLSDGNAWDYSFTQEWPLGGIRHQLSYTVPVQNNVQGTGLGDIGLNYRYQLLGNPDAPVVIAPRVSLLLPTGDHEEERGAGAASFQANLPVSVVLGPQLVTHWNAGATITPSAKSSLGHEATTTTFNLGTSAIWLLRPSFNLMVEALWLSEGSVTDFGVTARDELLLLNPGFRGAFDLANLQIVPGVAYTFDLSSDSDDDALFVYLSFEHPFKRQ
jgi:hypothetical protein